MRTEFYSFCDVILLFYDVTDKTSFSSLEDFLYEMTSNVEDTRTLAQKEFIVVANKIDKPNRTVTGSEGHNWALKRGFQYSEVSAAFEESVTMAFQELVSRSLKQSENQITSVNKNMFSSCTKEQMETLKAVKEAKTNHERLLLAFGKISSDEINRKFRHLSMLLHPDKCSLPGSEEAFKLLVASRKQLLVNVDGKK